MMLLRTPLRLFATSFPFSTLAHHLAVFDSQYHTKGLLGLRRPKAIEKLLGESGGQLSRKMEEVEQERVGLREKEVVASSQQYLPAGGAAEGYLKHYEELLQLFAKCPLNNDYVYKLLGWYNATPFFKPLVERLLDSSGEETICLLEALAWMRFQWRNPYGMMDEDLREKRRVERFYKQLSEQLEIGQLRILQRVVVAPLTMTKRKYYELYVAKNLEASLKVIQPSDEAAVGDLVWLFQQSIASMVDHDFLIAKFEKFLLTTPLQLLPQTLERLINLYTLKGRIDKNIYALYLKPYLLREKMGSWAGLVESIKFVVCSECGDNALLKTLYELVDAGFTKAQMKQSRHIYDLHLFTHYLRIKGYAIKLGRTLEKELTHFCSEKAEGRDSLNRLVIDNKALLSTIAKKKNKYVSECLSRKSHTISESSPTQRSQFENTFRYKLLQLKLDEMKIYQKPVFCCFQLDFCLQKKGTDQLMDVEIGGLQYVFAGSGRLVRQKEIRDEILTHYGFKVNHVDYNTFKARERISEEIMLMNKRVTHQDK